MDERLRELERRWQETGTLADEVALLRERLRTGDLDRARLRLAAAVGSEAAEQVVELGDRLERPWDWLRFLWQARNAALMEESEGPADVGQLADAPERLALLRATAALLEAAGEVGVLDAAHARCRRQAVTVFRAVCRDDHEPEFDEPEVVDEGDPALIAPRVLEWLHYDPGLEAALRDLTYALDEVAGLDAERQRRVVRDELLPWLLGR